MVFAFLNSAMGGFGSVRYDAGYPSGYFKGFTLSVDAITGDPALGGGWQSLSLGGMSMQTNELPAGGYRRTTFREVERIHYREVQLSRAWVPGTSSRITEWFSWANVNGSTTVAVTVEIPHQSDSTGLQGLLNSALGGALAKLGIDPSLAPGKKFNIIFRDCWPKDWQAPRLTAGVVNAFGGGKMEPTTIETLSFSFSGYKIEAFGGGTPMVDSSITTEEKVEPCKLVVVPPTGTTRSMLASMSNWTANSGGFSAVLGVGALKNAMARQIAIWVATYDSVEFYLPPSSMRITKGATWVQGRSAKAKGSGPVSYRGTQPMTIDLQFMMKTNNKDPFSAGGLMGGLTAGGGLLMGGTGKPRSVMDDLKKLISLCENYESFLSTAKMPPLVMLLWGNFCTPLMYIANLSADITRFDGDGTPSKAMGHMSLVQYPSTSSGTNPTSGGIAPELAETVLQGDTLAHLSYRTYEEPQRWRDIAEHNGIDDPLRVRAGTKLLLPTLDDLPARSEGGMVILEDTVDDFAGVEEED